MTLKLGQTMKDLTTGFTGIAINRITFLNGTVQYNLQPQSKEGTYPDAISIDENLLEVIGEGVSAKATPSTFESPIKLGNRAKCMINGLEGIITLKSDYLNGCTQFQMEHKGVGKDAGNDMYSWFDQCRLELVNEGVAQKIVKPAKAANGKQPGGPVMRGIPRG